MSHLLDRLNFLARTNTGTFSEGHGVTTSENRDWEDAYRKIPEWGSAQTAPVSDC